MHDGTGSGMPGGAKLTESQNGISIVSFALFYFEDTCRPDAVIINEQLGIRSNDPGL